MHTHALANIYIYIYIYIYEHSIFINIANYIINIYMYICISKLFSFLLIQREKIYFKMNRSTSLCGPIHFNIYILLPPKPHFSTCPLEPTSCFLCELRVELFLAFWSGSFWILSCTGHCGNLPAPFGLVVWVKSAADFGQMTLVFLPVKLNESSLW